MTAEGHRGVDFIAVNQPRVDQRLTKLLEGQSPELIAGFATTPHRESAGSVDLGMAVA